MNIVSELKTKLIKKTQLLGKELSLLPYEDKASEDLILELEENNPNELPFQSNTIDLLLGYWELIYASRGTVITSQLKSFPGAKIKEINQNLSRSQEENQVLVENQGIFDIPLWGKWDLTATGTWDYELNSQVTSVKFKDFIFSGSNILGLSQFNIPSLKIPDFFTPEAKWITSYLDEDFRIGRGITGNLFVFIKKD